MLRGWRRLILKSIDFKKSYPKVICVEIAEYIRRLVREAEERTSSSFLRANSILNMHIQI